MLAILTARNVSAERRRATACRMADMTLSWPRLTWPAFALRQAPPWARKISATSSLSRDTRSRFYEAFLFSVLAGSSSSGLLTDFSVLLSTWL